MDAEKANQAEEPLTPSRMSPLPKKRSRKKACCLWCCGITTLLIVLLIVIFIILIFTVFKQKNPTLKVDSVTIDNFSFSLPLSGPAAVSASLRSTVTVYNPNAAGFKYTNSTAHVYFEGGEIASSPVPAGEIGAKSSAQMVIPVDVHIEDSQSEASLSNDLLVTHVIPLVTTIAVEGTAKISFLRVKHVHINTYCDIIIYTINGTQDFHCKYNVKL